MTYWRHYVPTPSGHTILVSRNSDSTSSGRYLLADHLGGTDTVLDDAGNVALRASYGVFGNRRAADWGAGAPDWSGIANTTRRGYTGHEHLDNLALIHMHGRVYDPGTGRFLSVDPLIGDPGDSQQVNPYAYVGNRPLISIDPTGQELVCAVVCWTIVSSIVRSVVPMLGPDSAPPPAAVALPGQSAQTGVAMCSPGQSTASCAGAVSTSASVPSDGSRSAARGGDGADFAPTDPGEPGWGAFAAGLLVGRDPNVTPGTKAAIVIAALGFPAIAFFCAESVYICPAMAFALDLQSLADGGPAMPRGFGRAPVMVNEIPDELARVIPGKGPFPTLGPPSRSDVFVTAADDIAGMTPGQIAERLTIPKSDTFTIVRFPAPPSGVASPVFRTDEGFVGGGFTRGGAREFVIPNGPIPPGASTTVIGQ